LQRRDARSSKGLALLLKCVLRGDANALSTLGSLAYYKWPALAAPRLAYACYCAAADAGDVDAQYNLASALIEGVGTRKDTSRGLAALQKARRLGSAEAAYYLSLCLRRGIGSRRNLEESHRLCLEAAKRGVREAQYEIGVALYLGRGVKKDLAGGLRWVRRAARGGDPEADKFLSKVKRLRPRSRMPRGRAGRSRGLSESGVKSP